MKYGKLNFIFRLLFGRKVLSNHTQKSYYSFKIRHEYAIKWCKRDEGSEQKIHSQLPTYFRRRHHLSLLPIIIIIFFLLFADWTQSVFSSFVIWCVSVETDFGEEKNTYTDIICHLLFFAFIGWNNNSNEEKCRCFYDYLWQKRRYAYCCYCQESNNSTPHRLILVNRRSRPELPSKSAGDSISFFSYSSCFFYCKP